MSTAYRLTPMDDPLLRRALALVMAVCLLAGGSLFAVAAGQAGLRVPVIVRAEPGHLADVQRTVRLVGGSIDLPLPIIDGFAATVGSHRLADIAGAPYVFSITPNAPVRMQGLDPTLGYDPTEDGSLSTIAKTIGANQAWSQGLTGRGIDVALIDTGVAPAPELDGRVVNGPDLSFDSPFVEARYLDAYGHGSHMAGIIAARPAGTATGSVPPSDSFAGMAPDARIVSLKVASYDGATDVSQVLAAIDWVVQHRNTDGLNIRVLNLSFGTDGIQDYRIDPLAFAAEVAWRAGIVVVVAGGNEGFGSPHLNNPAYDPFVIAVGADNMRGSTGSGNDVVPAFSSRGVGRFVDIVAPGKSVISLRSAGSYVDEQAPEGRVGERFFRGSGTSQAAAVASGAVALLLQQRPGLTPDQVKHLIRTNGGSMPSEDSVAKGMGLLRIDRALSSPTPIGLAHVQTWLPSTGTGSLDAARGSQRVYDDGVSLGGEQDILGLAFPTAEWAARSASYTSWQGGLWMGRQLTGDGWCNDSWTGHSWTGHSWTGHSWTGHSWTGHSWTGRSWTGHSWTGDAWIGHSWTSDGWIGHSWSGAGWGP